MDLQNEFKDLELDKNLDKDAATIEQKVAEDNLAKGDKVVKDLQQKLKDIKQKEGSMSPEEEELTEDAEDQNDDDDDDEYEPTLYEKMQPFILPICLTFFAIIFAVLFLYFFSRSRVQYTPQAITNVGVPEQVYYPPAPVPVVVTPEKLTCTEPQHLNELGDACIDPEPVVDPVPVKTGFEDGTTTIVSVRFSFDKYNYDNYPRGIYMLKDQIFDGDYTDSKIKPTNRAFANDYFFGVDRYTVSLIGTCSYTIDDAKILVQNMRQGDKTFSGNVLKVVEASKPYVNCKK